MKKKMVLGVIFVALLLLVVSFAVGVGDILVPEIEKWQLQKQWDWVIGNNRVGKFCIGLHRVYQNPDDPKVIYGTVFSFIGSDEIILKAWAIKGEYPEKYNVAIKNEEGKWVLDQKNLGIFFLPEIQYGKIVSLAIGFYSENYWKGTEKEIKQSQILRTIKFNSPLSPQTEK